MRKIFNYILILIFLSGIIGLCYVIPQNTLADKITRQLQEYQKIQRKLEHSITRELER